MTAQFGDVWRMYINRTCTHMKTVPHDGVHAFVLIPPNSEQCPNWCGSLCIGCACACVCRHLNKSRSIVSDHFREYDKPLNSFKRCIMCGLCLAEVLSGGRGFESARWRSSFRIIRHLSWARSSTKLSLQVLTVLTFPATFTIYCAILLRRCS